MLKGAPALVTNMSYGGYVFGWMWNVDEEDKM